MPQVYKEYNHHFLLEPTKLTRIVDTIHGCVATIPGVILSDSFELFLNGDRHEELSGVDAVLGADNSRKHKIQRLIIRCSAAASGIHRPDYEVQVDFGGLSNQHQNPATKTRVISITVNSANASWNSRTLSQVEEQVERTWMRQTRTPDFLSFSLPYLFFFSRDNF